MPRTSTTEDSDPDKASAMSLLPELLLTVLFGAQASFTHPGIILPPKELLGDSELKAIIKRTQKSRDARYAIATATFSFAASMLESPLTATAPSFFFL